MSHLSEALSFACHSEACAPPPAGTGGSDSGGALAKGTRVRTPDGRIGRVVDNGPERSSVEFGDGLKYFDNKDLHPHAAENEDSGIDWDAIAKSKAERRQKAAEEARHPVRRKLKEAVAWAKRGGKRKPATSVDWLTDWTRDRWDMSEAGG